MNIKSVLHVMVFDAKQQQGKKGLLGAAGRQVGLGLGANRGSADLLNPGTLAQHSPTKHMPDNLQADCRELGFCLLSKN